MGILIKKFGGKCLETPQKIKKVARLIADDKRRGEDIVVIVSAMGDTTSKLISMANKIDPEPNKRELDMLLTSGERISMSLLSIAINSLGYEAISFTGSQSGIITDTKHTKAKILNIRPYRVKQELEAGKIVIIAGFQGVSESKEVTTLGRGGSDITALALALILGAKNCDLYKDVDGVHSVDPKILPSSKLIPAISYKEMLELSSLGAKVVHQRAVEIAEKSNITVNIKSLNGKKSKTVIKNLDSIEITEVRAVTFDKKIASVTLFDVPRTPHCFSQIVAELAKEGIPVKFFFHGTRKRLCDLSFIVDSADLFLARKLLKSALMRFNGKKLEERTDLGQISLIGTGIGSSGKILAKVFETFSKIGVHIESITTSEMRITCLLEKASVDKAVKALVKRFNL